MTFRTLVLYLAAALCAFGQALTITVADAPPTGMTAKPYSLMLTAAGGEPPYTWTITSGSLPAGLTLQNAVIAGTPNGASLTTVGVTVTDSAATRATATKTITIRIWGIYGPFETPYASAICQVDLTQTPPRVVLDGGVRRCLVVPLALVHSLTRNLVVNEQAGLDANGNPTYNFPNWWQYFANFFRRRFGVPMVDTFPTGDLAAAKANADAANAAVEAAKAAAVDQ